MTPGPVERKFATVKVVEDSEWGQGFEIHCGPERMRTIIPMGEDAERTDADDYAHDLNQSYESAIAEAVNEDVQKTINGMQAIEDMRRAEAVKAAVSEAFDAVIEFLRTEGLDECGRMIRVQRDILFKKIAQGATHG